MKVYLAGPMRGKPHFNFPAFHKAAAKLRELGHEVFSPAEKDIERHNGTDISAGNMAGCEKQAKETHGFDKRQALYEDTRFISLEAEAIALLPGWENSLGAQAEYWLSRALGHLIMHVPGEWL